MSEGVRKFLGRRRHFVDLQTVAFEWPFFFYQFELHRIRKGTGCRYMLPVSVGESLRGLLLLPDGPGEKVKVWNPPADGFAYPAVLATFLPAEEGGRDNSPQGPGRLFDRYKIHTVGMDYENIHCVRVTPHVYTTIPDLDKFVGAIGEIAASKKTHTS